jgi:hypothetical protein
MELGNRLFFRRLYLLLLLADHWVLLFRQLEKSLRRINQGGPRRPMREGARNV